MRHSLFGSEAEEDCNHNENSSSQPARAPSHERVDDGAIHRHSKARDTNVDITLKCDELIPWSYPNQFVKSLLQETSQHH